MTKTIRAKRVLVLLLAFLLISKCVEARMRVSIQLPWYINAEWAGLVMAKELGLDRQYGLDINLIHYTPGIDPVKRVLDGFADVGLIDAVSLIKQRSQGQEVKAIWAQMQISPLAVCTLEDKGIRKIEELKYKRIGIQKEYEYLLDLILSKAQIDKADLVVVYIKGDPVLPLERNEVDAACCFDIYQPPIMRLRGMKPFVLKASNLGIEYYEQVMFVTERTKITRSSALALLVQVVNDGWRYVFDNTDHTILTLSRKYFPLHSQENLITCPEEYAKHQRASLRLIKAYMTKGVGHKLGFMRHARWQDTINELLSIGFIDKYLSADEIFTPEYLLWPESQ